MTLMSTQSGQEKIVISNLYGSLVVSTITLICWYNGLLDWLPNYCTIVILVLLKLLSIQRHKGASAVLN